MKEISLVVAALLLVGCNSGTTYVNEPGVVLETTESFEVQCGEPIVFSTESLYETSVVIELPDEKPKELYGEYGINLQYTVFPACPEVVPPVDCNDTDGPTTPVEPVEPEEPIKCGEGTKLNEDNNTCEVIPAPVNPCGEGTEWDEDSESCIPTPPLECEAGFSDLDSVCMPDKYIPEFYVRTGLYEACIDGYKWRRAKKYCEIN